AWLRQERPGLIKIACSIDKYARNVYNLGILKQPLLAVSDARFYSRSLQKRGLLRLKMWHLTMCAYISFSSFTLLVG
ncbi:MAG: hypothetical protein AAB508_05190, partial [Patescibacteria group bacterium]